MKPPPDFKPRYNIAPGQDCLVLTPSSAHSASSAVNPSPLQVRTMRWGLVPEWAKDPAIGYKTINARSESVAEKPAFRDSFKKRRCLVPADGYYEWLTPNLNQAPLKFPTAPLKPIKIPMRFTLTSAEPFLFAGLWSSWKHEDAEPLESFTIITTAAEDVFLPFHDRQPVILTPEQGAKWLNPDTPADDLKHLMKAFPTTNLKGYQVSTVVNSGKNETPECVVPAGGVTWP